MPAVTQTGTKILITGANGFIGAWTVKTALERGFAVRAVVRSEVKTDSLKQLFASYLDDGKLEFAYVFNLTEDGAFDVAVKGVDAVLHLASPLPSSGIDPQDTIIPAVDGTLGILKSALKNGTSIKRIVITSSSVSIGTHEGDELRVYTEADWNEDAEAGAASGDVLGIYRASKTFAERAAWSFYQDHKDSVTWDLATINPPFVFGPPLQPNLSTPAELGFTQLYWWNNVISGANGEQDEQALGPSSRSAWVDVRDVAEAHVRALEREAASGQRIIVSSGSYIWQEWLDAANSIAPAPLKASLPKGHPNLTSGEVRYLVQYDSSKSRALLGLEYRTKEDTVRDVLEDARKRGWF